MSVMTPAKPAGNGQAKGAPAPAPRAFRIGVQSHDEIDYDVTVPTTVSTQDLQVLNVPPAGFLRGLYLDVVGTTAANAAAVTFAQNGPFNVIDTVTLEDVNSAPIVGPLNGYDLYLVNKYGGYSFSDDPKSNPTYSATTGAGATGGSFGFILRVPVEIVNRDALGALPNKSGTSMFKLRLRLAATATIYGVAPTNAPSVRVRIQQVSWWDPDPTDLKGRPQAQNPPGVQTTSFWSKAVFTLNAGTIRQPLERVGYLIRCLIFVLQDGALSRTVGETDFLDPATIQFEANVLISRLKRVWIHMMSQNYGYGQTAAIDTAEGRDSGVYVEPFMLDFGLKPGADTRRGYLPTSSAARLELQGNIGGAGAHTLTVITNDVAPAKGDDAVITT
jgi:hypothetical protein